MEGETTNKEIVPGEMSFGMLGLSTLPLKEHEAPIWM
jgi:hypothetical protein